MEQITFESLPKRCLLVFKTENCLKCQELMENINKANLEIEIVYIDETNGKIIGPRLAIMVSPTVILCEQGREIDRFYGVKTPELIEEFIK